MQKEVLFHFMVVFDFFVLTALLSHLYWVSDSDYLSLFHYCSLPSLGFLSSFFLFLLSSLFLPLFGLLLFTFLVLFLFFLLSLYFGLSRLIALAVQFLVLPLLLLLLLYRILPCGPHPSALEQKKQTKEQLFDFVCLLVSLRQLPFKSPSLYFSFVVLFSRRRILVSFLEFVIRVWGILCCLWWILYYLLYIFVDVSLKEIGREPEGTEKARKEDARKGTGRNKCFLLKIQRALKKQKR